MIDSRLANRLERKKAQLDALRPLPPSLVAKLHEQLALEWTYHSNAIEGNTLTLRETQYVLETGLTVGGKSLREHLEVINHRKAIGFVESIVGSDEVLRPHQVWQIHALVLKDIDDGEAGKYRDREVIIGGSAHRPPEAWEVPHQMEEWGQWLQMVGPEVHPVERAAVAHHRFVAIHPFIDGNGRTGRLIMNLLLLQAGYPITVIQKADRQRYYRVLEQADNSQPAPLINLIGRAVERSLTLYIETATPRSAPPPADEQWLSLRDAAEGSPYSQEYLSLLARRGRIEAIKRGRNWYTTRRAVADYMQTIAKDK